MNLISVNGWFERILHINANLWTWEVSFLYDEEPSLNQLMEMYKRDFPMTSQKGNPLFLKMIAFNSDSGRKIRYLVLLAVENFFENKNSYDRLLPNGLVYYGIADEVIRNENEKICECVSKCEKSEFSGNALFSFLKKDRLVILFFYGGRLCHWSEEVGYGGGFGSDIYENRMDRFRKFLEQDEYFSPNSSKVYFNEYRKNVEPWTELKSRARYFFRAARDPFWCNVDMDFRKRLKPLTLKKICVVILLLMMFVFALWGNFKPLVYHSFDIHSKNVAKDIELLPPPLVSVTELRDSMYRYVLFKNFKNFGRMVGEFQKKDAEVDLQNQKKISHDIKLRSIVEGVVFQGVVNGSIKWLRLGDTLGVYRVKSIGRDRVVMEGGGHTFEVIHE